MPQILKRRHMERLAPIEKHRANQGKTQPLPIIKLQLRNHRQRQHRHRQHGRNDQTLSQIRGMRIPSRTRGIRARGFRKLWASVIVWGWGIWCDFKRIIAGAPHHINQLRYFHGCRIVTHVGGFRGEVHRGLGARNLIQFPLHPTGTRCAGHAGDTQVHTNESWSIFCYHL